LIVTVDCHNYLSQQIISELKNVLPKHHRTRTKNKVAQDYFSEYDCTKADNYGINFLGNGQKKSKQNIVMGKDKKKHRKYRKYAYLTRFNYRQTSCF